ncbi:MAG TPA: response regulator [Blastocatellia bacterium]|nr:response regulator [Blastocatellia bacterium]
MSRKSVLVVDDSATFRQLLSMSLQRVDGITESDIAEAENGEEAMRKIAEGSFSLVITDIRMPKMDGLELVSRVRGELKRGDLPIIIISTKGDEADIEKGMSLGANGYLSKPISMGRLREMVLHLTGQGE